MVVSDKTDPKKTICSSEKKCLIENCDICVSKKSSDLCLKCKKGWSLLEEKCVPETIKNCVELRTSDSSKCEVCDHGYYITKDYLCESRDNYKPDESTKLSTIVLVLIAVCAAGGLAFYFYKRRQRADNDYIAA